MKYFVFTNRNHMFFSCVFETVQYIPGMWEPPRDMVLGTSSDITMSEKFVGSGVPQYSLYISDVKFCDSYEEALLLAERYRLMS